MSDKDEIVTGVIAISLVVFAAIFAIIFLPFAIVWALNVLFGLGLEFSFETWLAISIIGWLVNANVWTMKRK